MPKLPRSARLLDLRSADLISKRAEQANCSLHWTRSAQFYCRKIREGWLAMVLKIVHMDIAGLGGFDEVSIRSVIHVPLSLSPATFVSKAPSLIRQLISHCTTHVQLMHTECNPFLSPSQIAPKYQDEVCCETPCPLSFFAAQCDRLRHLWY